MKGLVSWSSSIAANHSTNRRWPGSECAVSGCSRQFDTSLRHVWMRAQTEADRVIPEDDPRYRRVDMSEADAYTARMAFVRNIARGESGIDLAQAAFQIAAEDDALVSHSSVQLPIQSFDKRIDTIVRDLLRLLDENGHSTLPRHPLEVIENKLYKTERFSVPSFGRTNIPPGTRVDNPGVYENSRFGYLHEALIRKTALPAVLAILYATVCQRLLAIGALDYAVRIDCSNLDGLPTAEALPALTRQAVMRSDGSIVNTCSSAALVEVLRYLKRSFWPFPWQSPLHPRETLGSLGDGGFQGAAQVALEGQDSADLQAIARVAKHRLERGIWTSPGGGDIRRTKAAAERLVLLCGNEVVSERRDLGILLLHYGDLGGAYAELSLYAANPAAADAPLEERNAVEKLLETLSANKGSVAPLTLERALESPAPQPSPDARIPLTW